MLDLLDLKILASLQKDARAPQKNIAKDLEISEPHLSKKINKLYENNIIHRQTIEIDLPKIGLNISAMTLIKEKKQSNMTETQAFLRAFPEAYQVHKVTGEWDYAVLWNCVDPEHLDLVLSSVVEHVNVDNIQTLLFMRTLKRDNCAELQLLLQAGRLGHELKNGAPK